MKNGQIDQVLLSKLVCKEVLSAVEDIRDSISGVSVLLGELDEVRFVAYTRFDTDMQASLQMIQRLVERLANE